MTFSILTYDRKTGIYAGAAATGSFCVGGWVLRGDIESGLCASQGTAPSTFWRDDAMRLMHQGAPAANIVETLTEADSGRDYRQLSVLDRSGGTAGFTGAESVPFADVIAGPDMIVAGNMIASRSVLEALAQAFRDSSGPAANRLLTALRAAEAAGSDVRGLQSAALLVLDPDAPPLDLRIDHSARPLDDLAALAQTVAQPPYATWLSQVPVQNDLNRAPSEAPAPVPPRE
ncbi:DUF1028 domain-containing protein [Roseisalinus antarcticus]|uniref:DUF1028 domain-containing protein n=1 Tax=Roseisalinus antarcticus TaxID=254357 RepID=A0A1Y5RVU9_9RHOB|nr:DUF1028 domain-containing protein [Roseisalinus antarcticus]SLN26459.1 hypothetical protein ROA7023_00822 [Roseisalinus antarcticus]